MTPKEQWEATQKANGLGITWEEHLAQREQDFAMAILNGLSGSNACKGADERRRMIPLHIADQAVAACDAEIAKLREENARLKAEVERLDGLCKQLSRQQSDISCENIMLRKAGDALENWIAWECDAPAGTADDIRDAWNAAKEGKPRA